MKENIPRIKVIHVLDFQGQPIQTRGVLVCEACCGHLLRDSKCQCCLLSRSHLGKMLQDFSR